MPASFKAWLADHGTMVVAFVGVCVLVGLGKVDPKVLEYVLMAMAGLAGRTPLLPNGGSGDGQSK